MTSLPFRVRAIFRDGKFVPQDPCPLPESTQVELVVEGPRIVPPAVTDPKEQAALLHDIVEHMMGNPIPESAPRFTRDQLHERR